jgi:glutamyl/glutaminyl-tRNA synthetase
VYIKSTNSFFGIERFMTETVVTRIAPTPSGYLHLGNAVNFILSWIYARKRGGVVHLRIDDIDSARIRPEYVEDIFTTLKWLGIDYDHGPGSAKDFYQSYSQKLKIRDYVKYPIGNPSFYVCSCSRRQLKDLSIKGIGEHNCQNQNNLLVTGENALRMVVTEQPILVGDQRVNLYQEMGDFIVIRRDGLPAYQLVSLIEDMQASVTHIIRGADLLPSTAAQLYLARALGIVEFAKITFYHHPLVKDEDGGKLSKSQGAMALTTMRRQGQSSDQIYHFLVKYMGWGDYRPDSLDQLLKIAPASF